MEPKFKEGEIMILKPHVEAKPEDYVIVNLLTTR
jgi:phage repressor protein C with HTH and peptisase S24 domain